ncbi:hypothetical protein COO60DRAFT_909309 [Scenedesmus sp. NREL 46B-D3]|nr:hypothetical protein COO60DRAFT_909309 [Scenedesmus sp. NREL 46B-D3]
MSDAAAVHARRPPFQQAHTFRDVPAQIPSPLRSRRPIPGVPKPTGTGAPAAPAAAPPPSNSDNRTEESELSFLFTPWASKAHRSARRRKPRTFRRCACARLHALHPAMYCTMDAHAQRPPPASLRPRPPPQPPQPPPGAALLAGPATPDSLHAVRASDAPARTHSTSVDLRHAALPACSGVAWRSWQPSIRVGRGHAHIIAGLADSTRQVCLTKVVMTTANTPHRCSSH